MAGGHCGGLLERVHGGDGRSLVVQKIAQPMLQESRKSQITNGWFNNEMRTKNFTAHREAHAATHAKPIGFAPDERSRHQAFLPGHDLFDQLCRNDRNGGH